MSVFKDLYQLEAEKFCLEVVFKDTRRQIAELESKINDLELKAIEILQSEKEQGSKGRIVENTIYGLKWNPPKPIVTDETKLPDRFFKIEKTLKKAELNKAIKDGETFEGVTIDNGSFSLTRAAKERG